jgi:hypothetical protein
LYSQVKTEKQASQVYLKKRTRGETVGQMTQGEVRQGLAFTGRETGYAVIFAAGISLMINSDRGFI